MADFIVARTYRGLEPGPRSKAIVLPAGKVISDDQYDIAQMKAWGLLVVSPTPARTALLRVTDDRPGSVADAILVDGMGRTALTGRSLIERKEDLPAPVDGVITLVPGDVYQFNGLVPIGTDPLQIVGQGTVLMGTFSSHDGIVYSGTGAAIRSAGFNLNWTNLCIDAPELAWEVTGPAPRVIIDGGRVLNADKMGVFDVSGLINVKNVIGDDVGAGFELTGAGGTTAVFDGLILDQSAGATGTMLDFGSTVWDILIADGYLTGAESGGIPFSGLPTNGNLTPGTGTGRILDSHTGAATTPIVGISPSDLQWKIEDTTGIPDSVTVGEVEMSGNAVATTISMGVFAKVAGTTVLNIAERMDDDGGTSNRLKYLISDVINVTITVSAGVVKSGGTVEEGRFQIFKKGSPVGPSFPFGVNNRPDGASFSLLLGGIVKDDFFELFVTNVSSSTAITVADLAFAVAAY